MQNKLLIGGRLVQGDQTIDVVNPATGKVFATCARASLAQLEEAVAAAKAAFPPWSSLGHEGRQAALLAFADAIEARTDEFARLLTAEQGKPTPQATAEVAGSIGALRTFAAMKTQLDVVKEDGDTRIYQQRVPLGVVAAITPWNFPLLLLMFKIGPALASGNTVVAKPAPTTPLTTCLLGEVAAGLLPPGVLNIIVDDNDLGDVLGRHPDVAKVSFTGSTATGKRVMENAASSLKRITLELGGNDAAIVLDDVDVAKVAPLIFHAAMLNAGQVCLAAKRIYVPSSLYDEMCDALAALARAAIVDDGAKQGTQIGPLQNRRQFERVCDYLDDAHASGTVIAGGAPLDRDGFFIPPTIVRDIGDDARLVREEQFGPVVPILKYDDVTEVIARANDSEFGLGGTVWTSNLARGVEVALQIDSGMIWVNKHLDLPFDVSFSGSKSSGFGAELGVEGWNEYTQRKVINVQI
jgi:acyl-CoA reductase-like NAD-dependent aldehyde dehydrogenase